MIFSMNTLTKEQVIEKLKEVKDPEIGIDIWTLGLIYNISIDDEGVEILMTLTTPFCPFADDLIRDVEQTVSTLLGDVDDDHGVRVELTFEPAWEPSAELRAKLGI
jgi:metal-sulfur cluster biosynthetic enzyme